MNVGILLFISFFYYFTTGPYLDLSDLCFRFLHIIHLFQFRLSESKTRSEICCDEHDSAFHHCGAKVVILHLVNISPLHHI